ncbi:MAG: hypothetical protein AAF610_05255 [Pseudomonadota bacterium]
MGTGRALAIVFVLLMQPLCSAQTPDYTLTETAVEISSGTTMYGLVRDYYPNHRNDWLRVARDLADANPDAFRNGDPGALIVGQSLLLIDYGDGIAGLDEPPPAVTLDEDEGAVDDDPSPRAPLQDEAERVEIATITRLRGTPKAIDRNNRVRALRRSAAIFRGDTLLTNDNEPLSLVMKDGAVMRVRSNTRLTFQKYRADARAGDERGSVMTLLSGGFRLTCGHTLYYRWTHPLLHVDTPSITCGLGWEGDAGGPLAIGTNTQIYTYSGALHARIYIHTYIHIYIHTYIHTYIYTYT